MREYCVVLNRWLEFSSAKPARHFCAINGTSSDWRQLTKMLFSGIKAACVVSFVDLDGIRHSVEVDAQGLYEASALGICAFRKCDSEPGGLTQLEVEVRSSI
jgi:hypothetical protein